MKDQKELGVGNFSAIPNGIGGVEHRMELIYQGVVAGELSLERWVETCSTTPARMFGMYPKKGVIAPGSDADVVVWDPNVKTKIGINDKHHMNMDHSAWEGWVIDGKVDTVLSRGTVVMENDSYTGQSHGHTSNEACRNISSRVRSSELRASSSTWSAVRNVRRSLLDTVANPGDLLSRVEPGPSLT